MATTKYRRTVRTNGETAVIFESAVVGFLGFAAIQYWIKSIEWGIVVGIVVAIAVHWLFMNVKSIRIAISVIFSLVWGALACLLCAALMKGPIGPISVLVGVLMALLSYARHKFYYDFRANATTTFRKIG